MTIRIQRQDSVGLAQPSAGGVKLSLLPIIMTDFLLSSYTTSF